MMTYDYENIEFATEHEDCHECEAMLVHAYTAFKQTRGQADVSTGDGMHCAQVAVTDRSADT